MPIDELLSNAKLLTEDELPGAAVELAAYLLADALEQRTSDDRHNAERMAAMMSDPQGKALTVSLFDQVFRSHDAHRVADQLNHLIGRGGVPHYFAGWERVAMGVGAVAGRFLPSVVVPAIVARVRSETSGMILPSEDRQLVSHLERRRRDGVQMNINYLGEAILGEEDAAARLGKYRALLARPDVDYISVKISSIFSQIDHVAATETLTTLKDRLRLLYKEAASHTRSAANGESRHKFVNLDMEAYGDLHLTFDAFTQTLDEPDFLHLPAGIVLQAYLPDAHPLQVQLTDWARDRVASGGAPIKLRIVKGANLATEKTDASWHGWAEATYESKHEVDANFIAMLRYGARPEHASAVRLGIGSHNLFDVAHALLARAHHGTEAHVEIEMLEGMVNHQARAVQNVAGQILLYAPIVEEKDFRSAIAYLIRRLDENTDEQNFLHDLFGMVPGDPAFRRQAERFLEASHDTAPTGPRRTQDRRAGVADFNLDPPFTNVADTDFSLPANQEWARSIRDSWRHREIADVVPRIGGADIEPSVWADGKDPSRPDDVAYRVGRCAALEVDRAISIAHEHAPRWASLTGDERRTILERCAQILGERRADLIGAMMLDGSKTIPEADVEVSEAIDFALYYARSLDDLATDGSLGMPLGVVTVAPPWNFPLAIPAGGVLAALAAGNTVLFKPARETVLIGRLLAECLWDAGVPGEALQFVLAVDDAAGQLVTDERVAAVILTGAWETGKMFLDWRPDLRLSAETSGKNALIVSAMSDRDQAIKDLVKSAFGHNGQKCSAASLGILEAEVYDDDQFLRQLADAVRSLPAGPAWELPSRVTPLIHPPGDALGRALERLDEHETWLIEPRKLGGTLWTPGVRLGVTPDSWFWANECFGPVLGLMRAPDVSTAIGWMNDSEFGLTGGIHSLDEREIAEWADRAEVGNGYINRHITGAIVRRQPFGGWKKSSFGSGAKAGGPNYVASFQRWATKRLPRHLATPSGAVTQLLESMDVVPEKVTAAAGSFAHAWTEHFSLVHDPSEVRGEVNGFRYRPVPRVIVRLAADGDAADALVAITGAITCAAPVELSVDEGVDWPFALPVDTVREPLSALTARLRLEDRVRVIGAPEAGLFEAARDVHARAFTDPVLADGRLELRWYLREQAVSIRTHRYGNLLGLGEGALESRES